jgi:cytochrome c oxidase assembly protein subunit 15
LIFPNRSEIVAPLRKWGRIALVFLNIQIVYGGFVAGMNAGMIHNHWPLMSEGKIIHETVWTEQPTLFKNLTEGKSGVQFVHRTLAYVVVGLMLFLYFKSRKYNLNNLQQKAVTTLVLFVGLQFLLGIFTLIYQVPLWLGLAHQMMAFLLLSAMVFTLHRFSK